MRDPKLHIPLSNSVLTRPRRPDSCKAYLNLGPRWRNVVQCSFRVKRGGYCGGHANKYLD